MTENEFDVVVVGAGAAGLCCAGTLVQQGVRVALISETPEVAWNLRPKIVEGNRGFVQHPVWQVGWEGGYWYPLARAMGLPVQFIMTPPFELIIPGLGEAKELSLCVSASAMVDLFDSLSPIPLDDMREDCERILKEIVQMGYRQLMSLSDVPLREWLAERGANPLFQGLMYLLCSNLLETSIALAEEHVSVFGAFGMLRGILCGETPALSVKPDCWTGLFVPMGKAIERLGGTVLRGAKVAEVLVEAGRATGVVLKDGTEIRARAVALATGTSRVGALLPQMPDDVKPAVDYAAQLFHHDVCVFTVLNKPLVSNRGFTLAADEGGSALAFLFPMHNLAPWSTQPGKQFLISQKFFTPKDWDAMGGAEPASQLVLDLNEQVYPGLKEATEAVEIQQHRHHWLGPLVHGPKLPRRTDDLPGLWFVGDGSTPVVGIAMDAAAGAGVCGAHEIIKDLSAHR